MGKRAIEYWLQPHLAQLFVQTPPTLMSVPAMGWDVRSHLPVCPELRESVPEGLRMRVGCQWRKGRVSKTLDVHWPAWTLCRAGFWRGAYSCHRNFLPVLGRETLGCSPGVQSECRGGPVGVNQAVSAGNIPQTQLLKPLCLSWRAVDRECLPLLFPVSFPGPDWCVLG